MLGSPPKGGQAHRSTSAYGPGFFSQGARLNHAYCGYLRFLPSWLCFALAGCGGGSSQLARAAPYHRRLRRQLRLSTSFVDDRDVSRPLASGTSGSMTIPVASSATSASLKFSATLPSGVVAVAVEHDLAAFEVQSIGGGTITLYGVIALTVSAPVTLSATPAFSFTLSKTPPANMYIAYLRCQQRGSRMERAAQRHRERQYRRVRWRRRSCRR